MTSRPSGCPRREPGAAESQRRYGSAPLAAPRARVTLVGVAQEDDATLPGARLHERIRRLGRTVVVALAPAAGAVPSTLGPCAGDLTGTIFTLTAACATTVPIIVTPGIATVSGAGPGAPAGGFAISASDTPAAQWNGAILQIPPG